MDTAPSECRRDALSDQRSRLVARFRSWIPLEKITHIQRLAKPKPLSLRTYHERQPLISSRASKTARRHWIYNSRRPPWLGYHLESSRKQRRGKESNGAFQHREVDVTALPRPLTMSKRC